MLFNIKWQSINMYIAIIIVILSLCSCTREVNSPTPNVNGDYRVIDVEDHSYDNVVIKLIIIVVFDYETSKDVANLEKKAIEDYISTNKVNAVTVLAYREGTDTTSRSDYFMGLSYAPEGNPLLANTVKTGDYRTFKYKGF